MSERIYGIMSAMPEEIEGLEILIEKLESFEIGKRKYYKGEINNVKVVVVFSRWGKVAAATTATTLIVHFGVTNLIFTGVAGAINPKLNIGDIVIGTHLIQHDMDASPLLPKFELPLLNLSIIESEEEEINRATSAVQSLMDSNRLKTIIGEELLKNLEISQPKLYAGFIASGDKFIHLESDKNKLIAQIPSILCVDMESAAVAQVCYENTIPFVVIRTISDKSDTNSSFDFQYFVKNIANKYSFEIIKNMFESKEVIVEEI